MWRFPDAYYRFKTNVNSTVGQLNSNFGRAVNELRVTSNGFLQCLDSVERASGWKQKFRKLGYGRGLVALSLHSHHPRV